MRILFMGTPDFAVPSLQKLIKAGHDIIGVVTQPDRPKGRKQVMTKSPVKQIAELMGIPIFQPEKIRNQEAIEKIKEWNPDLIVTAAYGQIIPVEILEVPRYKAINVHASLLPKFRGAAPIHQSIIQGEKETGITIMYMVKALDAGDILSQVTVSIDEKDTVGSLHDRLSQAGAKLLVETVDKIGKNEIEPIPQNDELATYAPTLKREDELINWDKTSKEIYNQVRGLNPWPGAFTYFNGDVFKIWWVEPVEHKHQKDSGTILSITKDELLVATKDGAIALKEVQPAGRKRMDIVSFLQGTKISDDAKMGEME